MRTIAVLERRFGALVASISILQQRFRSPRITIVTYSCTFCGEDNEVLVDPSGGRRQTFTEDCAVCCRPNLITLAFGDDGTVRLDAAQEYEA